MIKYHNLNGKIVDAGSAQIFVNDVGLLRGYGIFDFFPIVEGQPLFEEDYFDRFFRSAELMNLLIPIARAELHERVVDLAARNEIIHGYTKLVLTGGYAPDGYTPGTSNLFILQHDDVKSDPFQYSQGISLVLQKYIKDMPEVKTLNYANVLKNRDLLAQSEALDILYHDGRFIRETSRANFFIVNKDGTILTTEANVLSGITRKHVIKVARSSGIEVKECPLPLFLLTEASECFITSTTKGVLPVTKINGYEIGSGQVGPCCINLQKAYLAYCGQYVSTHHLV